MTYRELARQCKDELKRNGTIYADQIEDGPAIGMFLPKPLPTREKIELVTQLSNDLEDFKRLIVN